MPDSSGQRPDLAESDAQNGRWIKPSRLAGRQEGVIHRAQLHGMGLTDKQIGRGQDTGVLHELYVDVWTIGHRRVSPTGRLIGALLSCGPHSFLSHRMAAALHKLRPINVRAIEVSVVGGNAPRRPGLTVHRTRHEPDPEELRTRGLLRFSSFLRMLVEVAPTESDEELAGL